MINQTRSTMTPANLERLHESPQQDADGVSLAQQLDEPCGSKQAQKTEVDDAAAAESARLQRLKRQTRPYSNTSICNQPTSLTQPCIPPGIR